MAAEKLAAPLPLFAVSAEKVKKQQHAPAADPPFLPAGVRDVIKWALFHAGCVAFSVIYVVIVTSIVSDPVTTSIVSHTPSWLLPPTGPEPEQMTDAAVDVALMVGVLWCVCVVVQAVAGALALALPRRRLLLAYAALVATTAGHCMWAGLYMSFCVALSSGGFTFWDSVNAVAFFFSGAGDLLCFRCLMLHGGDE